MRKRYQEASFTYTRYLWIPSVVFSLDFNLCAIKSNTMFLVYILLTIYKCLLNDMTLCILLNSGNKILLNYLHAVLFN